ncbi:uncharacterized protein I303_102489 [Kwoniella dejecticola CBS 10117]|uniref:ER transporter 6TM N-terminal domain-containing protein n=1 Tax=Kwoniella dejecticola CBS 10117 TaxID=1296121 RepID=A0AAJ8KLZ9_9TREE
MPHQDDPGPSSHAPEIHIITTPDNSPEIDHPSRIPTPAESSRSSKRPFPVQSRSGSRSPARNSRPSSTHERHASFALSVQDDDGDNELPISNSIAARPATTYPPNAAGANTDSSDSVREKLKDEPEKKSWLSKAVLLSRLRARKFVGHRWFQWVGPKLTWKHMRPVARGFFSSWVGLLFLLIVPVERAIGNAAFFSIIVAFMLPPSQPVVQQFEVYLNLFFFNGLAWAWVALGVFIAGKTRQTTDPAKIAAAEAKYAYLQNANPTTYRERILYDGTYLQAKPAVICAIFLAVGTGTALWWKLRTQPSPATFPLVLSCVLIDIGLTTAVFYPYNLYTSGLLFFLPMAIQAGLGCFATLFIFPESVGHSFQSKFPGILNPLASAMKSIESLFQEADWPAETSNGNGDLLSTNDTRRVKEFAEKLEDWAERSKNIRGQLLQSLAGLPPLRAQQRYLNVDFSYSRLSGEDLRTLFDLLALVQARSGGMAFFFDVIVTNARHTHLDSSAWSVYKVNASRPGSRAASIRNESVLQDESRRASLGDDNHNQCGVDVAGHGHGNGGGSGSGMVTPPIDHDDSTDNLTHERNGYFSGKKLHFASFIKKSGSSHALNRDRGSHVSLLDHLRKIQQPVGVYESTRYMDIEKAFASDTEYVLEQLNILSRGCLPVIRACEAALSTSTHWISNLNRDRSIILKPHPKDADQEIKANGPNEKTPKTQIDKLAQVTNDLQAALDEFCVARVEVIKPYRHLFDPNHPADEGIHGRDKTNFRGLFQNFFAQCHLIEFTEALLNLLRQMQELDQTRQRRRFWYPRMSNLLAHLRHTHKDKHLTDGDDGHDNDAAFSRGDEDEDHFLGEAKKRNPEYKPFGNPYLNGISRLAQLTDILGSRSFMYAIKAAILGALTSLPNFIASSASFYYFNRGIWCTIMAQLTLAVFSGDTTVAWLGRVVASFWGCLFGMVAWYIGSGSGKGNPYGLAAVCAVTFPIAIFFRVHFPGQVLTAVMTPVTFGLSYFNGSIGPLTYAQWGWDVAWRRFVCVLIGITAAWIFSYIPPVYSAKRAIRNSYAQTINAAGSIFCDVLSHANDHHYRLHENDELRQKLITWRSKLNKLGARHNFASNEYSLRGQWPEERYKALLDTLQDLFSLLSQLNHVLTQLERPWRKALLDRTRLSDPTFLGDILAVLSMCSTALRAGTALPQITPSPLVARFRMGKTKGLDLPHDPTDPSGELPSLVTVDVLESDNYLRYALGITTTFSLISRLDRIVVICKTLLGENFHISGLHLEQNSRV